MVNHFRPINILTAALAVSTALSYALIQNKLPFFLLLCSFVILVTIRLINKLRGRLFWKIRNRLILSGIFLVITPILIILVFFALIGNVFISQYGALIAGNLMKERLKYIETTVDQYLKQSAVLPPHRLSPYIIKHAVEAPHFTVAIWEKKDENKDENYALIAMLPETVKPPAWVPEIKGYFKLNGKLYYGIMKKNFRMALLMALEINRRYLEELNSLVDLDIECQTPNKHPRDTNSLSFAQEYSYTDFDPPSGTSRLEKPMEKTGRFILTGNSHKIYRAINAASSGPATDSLKKFVSGFLLLFGTFFLVSFLIGFWIIQVITRSIDQLTNGTQRIRNGDFSFRIKTRSNDQMQYLGECFNEMAAGISLLLINEKEKQRLEEELRIARSIQLKLLPPESFDTDEFEIAAINIPEAEIAGDYFDYFYKPGTCLSLLVADVSGKGASAAFYMAELKGVVNHLQREAISPASLISECHYSLKDTLEKITFITMNVAKFNVPEKKLTLARAGHTPALFFKSSEKKCLELQPQGSAIGIPHFSPEKIKEVQSAYASGDILLLFSDGLTEIMNEEEEMLGIHRLKQIILDHSMLPAAEIKKKILDFSIAFSGKSENRDDLTFILLKVK
ncbi:MAG: SpoIIE family protein phosphatase [Candidatus Omnitrophota bacterium]